MSLNRTMQYGNKRDVNDIYGIILFKSYYVVWKPPCDDWPTVRERGLNRTMQYGNNK